MCGLSGFLDYRKGSLDKDLLAMQSSLSHRGSDDSGHLMIEEDLFHLGLAHNRLAIIDISPLGHQPMIFGSLSIILNGEIYNYNEIKNSLIALGHRFISNSDTEVVLHAFNEWGMDCVNRFIGMFAFVIFDSSLGKIYCCRDRAGVKPLYYYWKDDLFLFGSELKSLMAHSGFEKIINYKAILQYFKFGYIPGPITIFENAMKLEPGFWLTFDIRNKDITINRYWNVKTFYELPSLSIGYNEAKEEMERLLKSAFNYRMVSDVPVGIFLSGGFDSTLVTALIQASFPSRLKTYTIGFPDGVNEAPFAAKIAKHLGTEHNSFDCKHEDAQKIIPDLPYYFDEPCADISAIPTILVSKYARETVTVALSADGGDEIFAGYLGFKTYLEKLEKIQKIPFSNLTGHLLKKISNILPIENFSTNRKINAVSNVLLSKNDDQLATLINSGTGMPNPLVNSLFDINYRYEQDKIVYEEFDELWDKRSILFLNSLRPLKDQLLVKIDRATMSVGLEGREPFLDHRIIEFAARLPYEFKHDGKISKKIIRDIVYKYVPREMMNRPKTGFDLPIHKWLKAELNYLIEDNLDKTSIESVGCFNYLKINKLIKDFKFDNLLYVDIIWRLIVFQLWYKKWMN